MPDTKITALTAITTVDPAVDVLPIVDVSDTTMAASGTTKKITSNQILGAGGTATLASATITGNLTVDTNTLFVDAANNRVGIGTATPSTALEVATASTNTRVRINSTEVVATEYFRSGTGLWLVGSDSTNAFKIARGSNFGGSADYFAIASADAAATWYDAAGGTRMTLNSTGLGVGVTPSAWLASSYKALQVNTTGVLASFGSGSNQSTRLANNWFSNTSGVDTYITSNFATVYQQNSGQHQWYTAASGTAGTAITFTQAMTLDASGNLLVGTTSGTFKGTFVVAGGANRDILAAGVTAVSDGFQVKWNNSTSRINVIISNIPTSSAGLAAGTLWNDAGTIKIA